MVAWAQVFAVNVHYVGLTVDDGGVVGVSFGPACCVDDGLYGVGGVEAVAGVEEDDVFALCVLYSLVHGVVEPVVGLSDEAYVVGYGFVGVLLYVALYYLAGLVLATTVDDEVLDHGVGLAPDAVEGGG